MSLDPIRWLWAALTVLAWLATTAWFLWRARTTPAEATPGTTLIAVASQTGFGDELAEMTRAALAQAGVPARVAALGDVTPADLGAGERMLIVASTTGEGDAPDSAARFVRHVMTPGTDLTGLSYGLLSLGDRDYRAFCGFGRALDGWLKAAGAEPLFDPVEVDDGDAAAIRRWQDEIARLTGRSGAPAWVAPTHDRWTLVERRLLNPGSPGEGAWHLAFAPEDRLPDWVAGDLAEIGVPTPDGGLAHREYSIASLPSDGRVELLVRRMARPDGTPGLASGWLTEGLAVGGGLSMRVRTNKAFHGPAPATPMILVGNGTGIAGLRAHLKARAAAPEAGPTWLMFGERTARCDAFYDADLRDWLGRGRLARLDRAFSRDPEDGRYVQALIETASDDVRSWVADGAAIYVCGSREGMAEGVQAALERVLGQGACPDLVEAGRYRRDVY